MPRQPRFNLDPLRAALPCACTPFVLPVATALVVLFAAHGALAAPARTATDYQLIEAAYGGKLPRVRELLAQGAMVDAQDEYGYTALHWAAQAGWPLTSKVLLDSGASVDARDGQGRTPLLLATVRKQVEVARVLVAAGADPNAKDAQGNTPLEYARRKGMPQLTALLADAASNPRLPERPAIARPLPTATPKPRAWATPAPVAHATPRPVIRPPATPKPVVHATPKPLPTPQVVYVTPAPHPTSTTVTAASGPVALSAHFREEVARLYGLYTDHIGMRDPENLNQAGFNQKLEDQLEKIFHTLDYGSAASLSREKLHDARAWMIAARKDTGGDDRVCSQTLESLDQLLAATGF